MKTLGELLISLDDNINEITKMVPNNEEVYKDEYYDVFEAIHNLSVQLFNFQNEGGKLSDIATAEILFTANGSSQDVQQLFTNLDESYPEFNAFSSKEKIDVNKNEVLIHLSGLWTGTKEDFIRLTHHAEGLYVDTKFEYVHVEVCYNGEWYGR